MTSLEELAAEIKDGEIILFVGSEISTSVGLPNDRILAERLSKIMGISEQSIVHEVGKSFFELAQIYENRHGRLRLIQWLQEQFETKVSIPQSYAHIAKLPVQTIVSIGFDNLLENAFDHNGRKLNSITQGNNLFFWNERRVNLIKVRGSIEMPDSLVITRRDYNTYFRANQGIINSLITLLTTKTCLFIGYDWSHPFIDSILDQIEDYAGRYQRRGYFITSEKTDDLREYAKSRHLDIISYEDTEYENGPTDNKDAVIANILVKLMEIVDSKNVRFIESQSNNQLHQQDTDYFQRTVFPAEPNWFTNRISELEKLNELFANHTTIIIAGLPGIGKTVLGRRFGREHVTDRAKIWIQCEAGMTPDQLIDRIINELDEKDRARIRSLNARPDIPLVRKAFEIADILDESRIVLFLDNYESQIATSTHDFVRVLYEVLHNARIVLMTRIVPQDLPAAALLVEPHLGGLGEQDTIKLLQKLGLNNIELPLLSQVHQRLGGHPKLLEIFSYWAKRLGIITALNGLPESNANIQQFIITEVIRTLSLPEQQLLRAICTYRIPISVEAITAPYVGSEIHDLLQMLINRLLINQEENLRYSVHSLVREFCYRELGITSQLHSNAAQYFLNSIEGNTDTKLVILAEAFYHALQAQNSSLAYEVFLILSDRLDIVGHYEMMIFVCTELAALSGLSSEQRAHILTNLGLVHRRISDLETAISYHHQALAMYRELKQDRGEHVNLDHLASAYRQIGKIRQAIELHHEALSIVNSDKDPDRALYILCNLATAYRQVGQFRIAVEYHEKGVQLSERHYCDQRVIGRNLQNLGMAYYYLGEISKAEHTIRTAIIHNEAAEDRRESSDSFQCLGLILWYEDQLELAEEFCEKAIKICREIGYSRGEANARGNLGLCYLKRGMLDVSYSYIEDAVSISNRFSNKHAENRHLTNLGQVLQRQGNKEKSLDCLFTALQIADEIEDLWGKVHSLYQISSLLKDNNQYDEALTLFFVYTTLFEQLNSPVLPVVTGEIAELVALSSKSTVQNCSQKANDIVKQNSDDLLGFARSLLF